MASVSFDTKSSSAGSSNAPTKKAEDVELRPVSHSADGWQLDPARVELDSDAPSLLLPGQLPELSDAEDREDDESLSSVSSDEASQIDEKEEAPAQVENNDVSDGELSSVESDNEEGDELEPPARSPWVSRLHVAAKICVSLLIIGILTFVSVIGWKFLVAAGSAAVSAAIILTMVYTLVSMLSLILSLIGFFTCKMYKNTDSYLSDIKEYIKFILFLPWVYDMCKKLCSN